MFKVFFQNEFQAAAVSAFGQTDTASPARGLLGYHIIVREGQRGGGSWGQGSSLLGPCMGRQQTKNGQSLQSYFLCLMPWSFHRSSAFSATCPPKLPPTTYLSKIYFYFFTNYKKLTDGHFKTRKQIIALDSGRRRGIYGIEAWKQESWVWIQTWSPRTRENSGSFQLTAQFLHQSSREDINYCRD